MTIMCRTLGMTTSGYYSWRGRPLSQRAQADRELLNEIRAIHRLSRGVYGSPKIHQVLQKQGWPCSRKKVASLMSQNRLAAKKQRCFRRTTQAHARQPVAANHLSQQFTAKQPNQVWLADITYVRTKEGWLYLAAVMDLYSRQIVGWSMSKRMTDALAMNAMQMAIRRRQPSGGKLMHHSDRGSQYTSKAYQKLLKRHGIQGSMSDTGNCYDNAPMESFFSLLKTELVHHERYMNRREARAAIFDYLEVFYNRQRIHSAIDYQTPVEYESLGRNPDGQTDFSNRPLGGGCETTHP